MRGSLVGWLAVFAACGAPPAPVDVSERVALQIEFEPPLREPGELHYAHECGEQGTVPANRSGVTLSLPPGPVVLTLRAAGVTRELVLHARYGAAAVVWPAVR